MELNSEANELVQRLATKHLLHWMEVLSFIGRIDVACSSLAAINTAMVCSIRGHPQINHDINIRIQNRNGHNISE